MNTPIPEDLAWPPPWLDAVRRRVRRWSTRGAGTSWVVAVSGGSDSVGLLRVLHGLASELGLTLSVAHLDHGVRGEAARADARFVEGLAGRLGLPFDLGHWRPERTGHFEADARRARYEWLERVAAARQATAVAVGHTRDDQAETILHRIIRGTGPGGLSGMPARRVLRQSPPLQVVRPLLTVSRRAIRESLRAMGQDFREDASNADLSRTRAWVRHDLLPRIAARGNPRVVEALARLGQLSAASRRLLEHWLDVLEPRVLGPHDLDRIELRRDQLRELPPDLRAELIRRAWRRAGWPEAGMSAERWRRLARRAALAVSGRCDVGEGVVLEDGAEPDAIVLRRGGGSALREGFDHRVLPLGVPGDAPWLEGRVVTIVDPDTPRDETVDLDRIVPPLAVRAPAPGDRFAPLGMQGRSTPLNDFFRGRGIGPEARTRTPLVCDAEGIIWVVGHRIADRVRLRGSTTRTLGLRWEPAS